MLFMLWKDNKIQTLRAMKENRNKSLFFFVSSSLNWVSVYAWHWQVGPSIVTHTKHNKLSKSFIALWTLWYVTVDKWFLVSVQLNHQSTTTTTLWYSLLIARLEIASYWWSVYYSISKTIVIETWWVEGVGCIKRLCIVRVICLHLQLCSVFVVNYFSNDFTLNSDFLRSFFWYTIFIRIFRFYFIGKTKLNWMIFLFQNKEKINKWKWEIFVLKIVVASVWKLASLFWASLI